MPSSTSPYLFYDSSGLGKRYVVERGTDVLNDLFRSLLPVALPYLVYIEVANIIRRQRNNGVIDTDDFNEARNLLESEILKSSSITLLSASDQDLLASVALADAHNLNSSDAVILYVIREFCLHMGVTGYLVASDARLLRAAQAEGLLPLNPESTTTEELAALGVIAAPSVSPSA